MDCYFFFAKNRFSLATLLLGVCFKHLAKYFISVGELAVFFLTPFPIVLRSHSSAQIRIFSVNCDRSVAGGNSLL